MSDVVTVSVPQRFRPWQTPNFASPDRPPRPRQEGFSADQGIPVAELTDDALFALTEAWVNTLWEKVGKAPPRLERPA